MNPGRSRLHPAIAFLAIVLPMAVGGGCGGNPAPVAPASSPASDDGAALARVGDVTMHASVMQTSSLDQGVAKNYGIARSDNTILLLIAVRKGADADDAAIPATITAVATDLGGRRHAIDMRELRTGSLLDYIGSIDVSLPETLRFDITIVREDGQRSQMRFNREFFPR